MGAQTNQTDLLATYIVVSAFCTLLCQKGTQVREGKES